MNSRTLAWIISSGMYTSSPSYFLAVTLGGYIVPCLLQYRLTALLNSPAGVYREDITWNGFELKWKEIIRSGILISHCLPTSLVSGGAQWPVLVIGRLGRRLRVANGTSIYRRILLSTGTYPWWARPYSYIATAWSWWISFTVTLGLWFTYFFKDAIKNC